MDEEVVLLVLIVGSVFLGLVAIVGGFLHYRRERLLTHTERIKALELGRDLPNDAYTARLKAVWKDSASSSDKYEDTEDKTDPDRALARKCYSVALWGLFWGFLFAASNGPNNGIAYVIASATGAIGVTAVICGTILASRAPRRVDSGLITSQVAKQSVEADAYDVVGSRG